jgi:hypothetical protein
MYHPDPHHYRSHDNTRHRATTALHLSTSHIIFITAICVLFGSIWLSISTQHWHWFSRAGSVLVVLGILLTSNQIIENSKRLRQRRAHHTSHFRHDYAEEYQQHTLERASLLEEDIWQNGLRGMYLLVSGTLIWGFGDLVGALVDSLFR